MPRRPILVSCACILRPFARTELRRGFRMALTSAGSIGMGLPQLIIRGPQVEARTVNRHEYHPVRQRAVQFLRDVAPVTQQRSAKI